MYSTKYQGVRQNMDSPSQKTQPGARGPMTIAVTIATRHLGKPSIKKTIFLLTFVNKLKYLKIA